MDTKKPWQSKTLVLNAVIGLAAAASLFLPQAATVPTFITAHGAEIAMGWSLLNMVLRLVSKDKISLGE